VRFVASAAFREIDSTVYGALEADLNGDAMPDGIVVQKVGPGFAPAVYMQAVGDEKTTTWSRACTGDGVVGDEIETLRWVEIGGKELVLLAASVQNPDEVVVDGRLFDPRDDCATRYNERLVLTAPNGEVVAPFAVPGGFTVTDSGVVQIVDRARYLTLGGPEGEVSLLRDVRIRRLEWSGDTLVADSKRVGFLVAREVEARWLRPGADPAGAPELVDGDDHTAFAIRPDETAALALVAPAPILMLELHHGCPGAEPRPLELALAGGKPYDTGTRPGSDSFVRASGRGHATIPGVKRDLLALSEPTNEIALAVGPGETERCLREVRAYGFHVGGAP
jgi:hypothetical protein